MSLVSTRPISSLLRRLQQHHSTQLMNRATRRNVFVFKLLQSPLLKPLMLTRNLSCTPIYFNNNNNNEAAGNDEAEVEEEEDEDEFDSEADFIQRYLDPKDRSRVIPPEISMKYMESVAFKTTYGSDPVWKKYRRNFKGGRKPLKTRETCIRPDLEGVLKIATGSPCPICRDEYLVIDYRNVALLKHFIDPYTGKILSPNKTNICQKQWRKMQIHMEKARDHGYLDVDCPSVEYDYRDYVKQ